VARALINKPARCLQMTSGNLDTTKKTYINYFKLRDEFGQTFVIVTHNEELAA
jgi:lipoprotein-releasing system ATP-binding protein